MFFGMYVRESLFILLLVTYIRTDFFRPSILKTKSISVCMFTKVYSFCYLQHTYTRDRPRFLCSSALTTSTSVNMYVKTRSTYMYVKPGQHTCMLSAFLGEHTYTPTNLGSNIHTESSYLLLEISAF